MSNSLFWRIGHAMENQICLPTMENQICLPNYLLYNKIIILYAYFFLGKVN